MCHARRPVEQSRRTVAPPRCHMLPCVDASPRRCEEDAPGVPPLRTGVQISRMGLYPPGLGSLARLVSSARPLARGPPTAPKSPLGIRMFPWVGTPRGEYHQGPKIRSARAPFGVISGLSSMYLTAPVARQKNTRQRSKNSDPCHRDMKRSRKGKKRTASE